MIEFLGIKTAGKGDASAARLDPAWSPPGNPATVKALTAHWELATKHVVHFSNQSHVWKSLNRRRLDFIADDVLTVWDDYAAIAAHPMIQRRGQFTRLRYPN
ncbi:hypothetical protein ACQ86B_17520 [Mycolicibacterium aichiense]|uniref:hypothetical protein n=1 Tax=Mycolicibacterium aichiense TaxID=1799 RepID=UPI003D678FDB